MCCCCVSPSDPTLTVEKVVEVMGEVRDWKEAPREFVKGQDVFVSLPTGSGKSLCYGCLPLVYDSLCSNVDGNKSFIIVVSPLKALMQDQVRAFCAKCLESAYTT